MRIAALAGENERASALADAARQQVRDWATYDEWSIASADAGQWYDRGDRLGDNAALSRAIMIYRDEVLPLAPRARTPRDWATTQQNLGLALAALGERYSGTARLQEAVAAYRLALEALNPTEHSYLYEIVSRNIASVQALIDSRR